MQSTPVRPNSDAVSEDSAANARRRPPASTVVGASVSANAKNKDGNIWSGGANDKSIGSAPTNETDSAVEADMARAMGRFLPRGPPSEPARGPRTGQATGTPSGSTHTAPTSTTENKGRIPAQTANVHTTKK